MTELVSNLINKVSLKIFEYLNVEKTLVKTEYNKNSFFYEGTIFNVENIEIKSLNDFIAKEFRGMKGFINVEYKDNNLVIQIDTRIED
jgi:hypothetical protein